MLSYVDQFADDTFGVAIGFAHLDSPGQARNSAPGVTAITLASGARALPAYRPWTAAETAWRVQGHLARCSRKARVQRHLQQTGARRRDGSSAVQAERQVPAAVDLYDSKFEQDRTGHHWTGDIGLWNGGPNQPPPANFTNVQTGEVDGNTIIDSATIDGSHSLVYDKNWDRTDEIRSIGWRNELNFTDQWKGTLDLGYSRADRDETYIQSVARANAFSSFAFTTSDSQLAWSTPQDLTDPTVVQLTNDPNWAEMRTPKFKDENQVGAARGQSQPGVGLVQRSRCGLRLQRSATRTYRPTPSDLELTGPSVDPVTGLPLHVIPTDALRDPVMINIGGIQQGVVSWDVPSIMGLYAQVAKDPWLAQTNKFQVHEKIQTAFLRFVIDSKLGSVPVRGNLGVQYVYSEQNSDGFAWNDGAAHQPVVP